MPATLRFHGTFSETTKMAEKAGDDGGPRDRQQIRNGLIAVIVGGSPQPPMIIPHLRFGVFAWSPAVEHD